MTENELATRVLDHCFEIHRNLGPGLSESVYAAALELELKQARIPYEREQPVVVEYKGSNLGLGFRTDFVVGEKLIVELKSVETVNLSHLKQLLRYLRITNIRLRLLVDFREPLLRSGITRVVNTL